MYLYLWSTRVPMAILRPWITVRTALYKVILHPTLIPALAGRGCTAVPRGRQTMDIHTRTAAGRRSLEQLVAKKVRFDLPMFDFFDFVFNLLVLPEYRI